jgi:hypothetical protein
MPKAKKTLKKAEKPLPLAKIAPLSLAESVEKVLIAGDLSPLTPAERVDYYKKVCMSLGLNPLTSPFMYILFQEPGMGPAKLSLYATKSCAEQLRKLHGISVLTHTQKIENDMCYVEVQVQDRTGRTDMSMGVVPLWKVKDGKRIDYTGKDLANALMKCSTKAKRRATLSIAGLAFLDESELDTMQVVGGVTPDGRIYQYRDAPPAEQPALNENAAHGHAPGSPQALMAEAALKRSEEEDRKLAESQKASEKAFKLGRQVGKSVSAPEEAANLILSIHPDLTRTSDIPVATVVQPLPDLPADAQQVLIDWHDKDNPVVTGDADAIEALKPLLHWGTDEFWHVKAEDAVKIGEACAAAKYRFQEILPETSSGRSANSPKAAAREGGGKPKATTAPAAEPIVLKGIIEQTAEKMTRGVAANPERGTKARPSVPYLSIMVKADGKSQWYSAFKKDWFEHLTRGKGKEAELYIEKRGEYWNLVGLKRIGALEFEDNLPVIQKNREAGSPGLFP